MDLLLLLSRGCLAGGGAPIMNSPSTDTWKAGSITAAKMSGVEQKLRPHRFRPQVAAALSTRRNGEGARTPTASGMAA